MEIIIDKRLALGEGKTIIVRMSKSYVVTRECHSIIHRQQIIGRRDKEIEDSSVWGYGGSLFPIQVVQMVQHHRPTYVPMLVLAETDCDKIT